MALTEKEYAELTKYAYNVAQKYVQNTDNALDIAQNALLALISSKAEIANPQSWLHTIVRREASLFLKVEQKELDLIEEKKINTVAPSKADDESDDIFNVDSYKVYRLLKKDDYEEYKRFRKYQFNLTKFAAKEKVSYDTAHQRKYKLRRNLQAVFSLDDGWKNSPRILNYTQYTAIVRFIKQLKRDPGSSKKAEFKVTIISSAKENFEKLFANVIDCMEWTVEYKDDGYILTLICRADTGKPCFFRLNIEFNAANYLQITGSKQCEVMMIVDNANIEGVQKYKKKGKIDLPTDKALAILTNKQTTR